MSIKLFACTISFMLMYHESSFKNVVKLVLIVHTINTNNMVLGDVYESTN